MVSATGRSTVVTVRFLIRWNLLQYIGSLWRCVTLRSRRRGLTPRSNRSGRSGYRHIRRRCSNLFMFHRGFCDSSGRVPLGGERIFLTLEVSIFGCWIKFQFLGTIKICTENLVRETGKSHDVFTSVEISVKLGHSKGRGGGTGEREDEAPASAFHFPRMLTHPRSFVPLNSASAVWHLGVRLPAFIPLTP
jgi:hypothetical protein